MRNFDPKDPKERRIPCPLCGLSLLLGLARSRKTGKTSISLKCPKDGRHFRGFITDREYVTAVTDRLEELSQEREE